jgi:hypothetical protein
MYRRKACTITTLSITNSTWNALAVTPVTAWFCVARDDGDGMVLHGIIDRLHLVSKVCAINFVTKMQMRCMVVTAQPPTSFVISSSFFFFFGWLAGCVLYTCPIFRY